MRKAKEGRGGGHADFTMSKKDPVWEFKFENQQAAHQYWLNQQ